MLKYAYLISFLKDSVLKNFAAAVLKNCLAHISAIAAGCGVRMESQIWRKSLLYSYLQALLTFPKLSQSCDAGAVEEQKCRPLTHFCFTLNEPGWKTSLCCPKPCRDPTPVFSDGQCLVSLMSTKSARNNQLVLNRKTLIFVITILFACRA